MPAERQSRTAPARCRAADRRSRPARRYAKAKSRGDSGSARRARNAALAHAQHAHALAPPSDRPRARSRRAPSRRRPHRVRRLPRRRPWSPHGATPSARSRPSSRPEGRAASRKRAIMVNPARASRPALPARSWKARSIGSSRLGRAARARRRQSTRRTDSAMHRSTRGDATASSIRSSAIDIRLTVNVPVLSVHRTVAAPSVSIAEARRVSTRARGNPPRAHRHEDG